MLAWLIILFSYAGFVYAVITAPVDGANIGGGMLIWVTPFVALCGAKAVYGAYRRARSAVRDQPSGARELTR
jgi:hypothetical protein